MTDSKAVAVVRFVFPGFITTGRQDTSFCEVETGTITAGGQDMEVIVTKSKKAPKGASFLPTVVKVGGKQVWGFRDENFEGMLRLAMAGNTPVIAFTEKRGRDVFVVRVLPLEDTSSLIRMRVGDEMRTVGKNRSVQEVMALKRAAAEWLGIRVELNEVEEKAYQLLNEHRRLVREGEMADREARRREMMNKIISRPKIYAFRDDGRRVSGFPVIGEEWQCLKGGEFVIRVELYNDEDHSHGVPVEAFYVNKSLGGRVDKGGLVSPIFAEKPIISTRSEMPSIKHVILVDLDGLREVFVYHSMDEIRKTRELGLNGGTFVTAETEKSEDGKYTIYAVYREKVETVKKSKAISMV